MCLEFANRNNAFSLREMVKLSYSIFGISLLYSVGIDIKMLKFEKTAKQTAAKLNFFAQISYFIIGFN